MLSELLASVVALAHKTREAKFYTHPNVPQRLWLGHGDDDLREIEVPPPLRAHKLHGFDDLVRMLREEGLADNAEVYVSGSRVAAFLDGADRREIVSVDLVESKRFALCSVLSQPRQFQPRDAIKMLRLDFHGGQHDHVIQALSRVDFTRTSAGKSDVVHGRETLGRSVEASVQQAESIPSGFAVVVPIWTTSGFTKYSVTVQFGVHLDLEAQTVELRVLSDEVERTRNIALAAVAHDLREALGDVPVFMGTP